MPIGPTGHEWGEAHGPSGSSDGVGVNQAARDGATVANARSSVKAQGESPRKRAVVTPGVRAVIGATRVKSSVQKKGVDVVRPENREPASARAVARDAVKEKQRVPERAKHCKDRPERGKRGSGGGKGFVPWCNRR